MITLLSFNQLKEASQNHQTTLVIYRALDVLAKVRQTSIEAIDAMKTVYKNEGDTTIILENLKQWYKSLAERIYLDEAILMDSPEQVVDFYRSKWRQARWTEEVILEDLMNSLRSVVVAIQAGMQMLKSEVVVEQPNMETLDKQTAIFFDTHQLLREYLVK